MHVPFSKCFSLMLCTNCTSTCFMPDLSILAVQYSVPMTPTLWLTAVPPVLPISVVIFASSSNFSCILFLCFEIRLYDILALCLLCCCTHYLCCLSRLHGCMTCLLPGTLFVWSGCPPPSPPPHPILCSSRFCFHGSSLSPKLISKLKVDLLPRRETIYTHKGVGGRFKVAGERGRGGEVQVTDRRGLRGN